jgi:purine-binding chemotaxis protein CheW
MSRSTVSFGAPDEESILKVLRQRAESLAAESSEETIADALSILLFGIGEEWYGVTIPAVREIYNEYLVTPIPCVPPFVLGVINIRGEIVSVTDLRTLLRLPQRQLDLELPVIVVEHGDCSTALVVDVIGDIEEIPKDSVEPPVAPPDKSQAACVSGSVYVGGKLVGLLDLGEILAPIGAE